MPQLHALTITVNDQLTVYAGYWQECVAEDQTPYRLISPPQTAMYRQALSYLEEAAKDMKAPAKSRLHFGEVAIATVAVCLRWGSYFAVLANHDLPQWAAAFDPEVSCIGDGEMTRINIEASAALAGWIDLMRADQQRFRKLVKAAVQLLPFPIAHLDGSTYYSRFRALGSINSINGILNEHWLNGSGIEDIHAGVIAPPRPLTQCRLTKAQETLLMQETAELFVPTLRALYHVVSKSSEEAWPEQALPYALAFRPPADWTLDEQTREFALPGTEPQ
jgi:hypothetical protein